jgi:hypothetical protein
VFGLIVSKGTPGSFISPETPFTNKVVLENLIGQCRDYVLWEDKYFSKFGLEILSNSIDSQKVRTIELLVCIGKDLQKLRDDFKRFAQEMSNKGVSCEMRVITDKNLASSIHDRWIISANACFNLPSTDVVGCGQYSQINLTENKPPFDKWWDQSLDIIKDWNRILSLL